MRWFWLHSCHFHSELKTPIKGKWSKSVLCNVFPMCEICNHQRWYNNKDCYDLFSEDNCNSMSYSFFNLLILIYFEWWKQFNYLSYKKHVDRKSIWNQYAWLYGFLVSCYILSCVTDTPRHNKQIMPQEFMTNTLIVSNGIVQRRSRRSKKKEKEKVIWSRPQSHYLWQWGKHLL